MAHDELIKKVSQAIIDGDAEEVVKAGQECLDQGVPPLDIIQKGGGGGLDVVGQKFEELELFLPDLMMAAEAMQALISLVSPKTEGKSDDALSKVIFGTVAGDLHDIGKNLCINQLQLNGFQIVDLGVDAKTKDIVEAAEAEGAQIIALSALMSTSAYYQKDLVDYLERQGLREKYYVVVGGGPVTEEWAKEAGADGYGKTAVSCVRVCKELLESDKKPGSGDVVVA